MMDQQRLIDLISDRLRTEVATAEREINQIMSDIHRELNETGVAECKGLGTFFKAGNHLRFEPDPQLSMDVNFRYHGLEPILLQGADRTPSDMGNPSEPPHTSVFVVVEQEDSTEVDTELEELLNMDAEAPAIAHPENGPVAEIEAAPSQVAMTESKLPAAPDKERRKVHRPIELKTPPLSRQNPHTIPIEIVPQGRPTSYGATWRRVTAFTVFLLLLLAMGGVAWYNGWLDGAGIPSFHSVFPDYATRNDPGSITLETPTIDQVQKDDQDQGLVLADSTQSFIQSVPPDTIYGLSGSWNEELSGFYYIVSATMFTEPIANQVFDEVDTANLRARLFRVRVRGETAWELHVGQFETRDKALEANLTLDRKFQSDVVRLYGQQ